MSKENPIKFEDFKLENVLDPDYKSANAEPEPTPIPEPVKPTGEAPVPPVVPQVAPTDPGNDEDDEEVLPENPGQTDSPDEFDLRPFYQLFHEKLGWEVKEEDLPENSNTIDGFIDYMNSIVEENSRPKYSNELSEQFDKFLANGGDPSKFMSTMFAQKNYEDLSLDSDNDKKQVVLEYLLKTNPDKDKDWASKKIERYETSGVLDDEAADALTELKGFQARDKATIVAKQEQERQAEMQAYREHIANLETTIKGKTEIGGIPLSKKEGEDFFKFLTQPDKEGVTGYHRATQKEDASLIMAYVAFKGFNVNNLKQAVKNDVIAGVKKSLSKFSSSTSGLNNKTSVPVQSNKIDYKAFDVGT